jgi:hypothetical protein
MGPPAFFAKRAIIAPASPRLRVARPREHAETIVTQADAPRQLVYKWGGNDMRWQLEAAGGGTRLTLWTSIPRAYIAMGARRHAHRPHRGARRHAGPRLAALHAEYAQEFGSEK